MSKYRQSFIKGTMILLAAGIINRLLGFVPRIMLPRVIGAEGVGLYQMGYPLLVVILTFITGGIPLAVAKLVAEAESNNDAKRIRVILYTTIWLMVILSITLTIAFVFASAWISSKLFTDTRVYYTFLCMSPIIPIIAVSSAYRGYFQGKHNMIPTAVSQVVETIGRIVAMLAFSFALLPYGIEFAAAGAMAGVVFGEICGMIVLLVQYRKNGDDVAADETTEISQNARHLAWMTNLRHLLRISIPVTASRLVGSASYFLESVLIVQSLAAAGVATHIATTQYGTLQGMVIPLLLMPTALTYSLAVSLIPSLSEAAARGDMQIIHKRLHQSLRLALVAGAPFAVFMFILAEPLCLYLYNDASAGAMLRMMAPVGIFLYFQGPLQATLQALDKPGAALLNTFIGAAIKLILIVQLTTSPKFGILGAVIAINVNVILVTALHWHSVVKLLRFRMKTADFIKVGFGMAFMGAICWFAMNYDWIDLPLLRFLTACLLGGLVYLISIVVFRLVDKHDLVRIPWIGARLAKWL